MHSELNVFSKVILTFCNQSLLFSNCGAATIGSQEIFQEIPTFLQVVTIHHYFRTSISAPQIPRDRPLTFYPNKSLPAIVWTKSCSWVAYWIIKFVWIFSSGCLSFYANEISSIKRSVIVVLTRLIADSYIAEMCTSPQADDCHGIQK